MELFGSALGLGAIGFAAGLVGAIIAAAGSRDATTSLTSHVQHFAAGLIIAAATLDLLPEAMALGGDWALVIGFVLGTVFMLALRSVTQRLGHGHGHGHGHGNDHGDGHGASGVNLPLTVALAVVVLIDGAIIGIALAAGGAAATLIAIALATELLFVAASIAGSSRLAGARKASAIGAGALVALMLPIGAVLGAMVFSGVSTPVLVAALGFGSVALLFTAIEELLLEAHEIKESAGTAAMGAAGFLTFLVLMLLWPAA